MRVIAGVAVTLLLAVTGCSDSDSQSVTAVTPDPNDTADDTKFAFTSTITITPDGFQPRDAVAVLGETLTFVNQTAEPQTISFTNGALSPGGVSTIGPIPPGQSMSAPEPLSSTISLVYMSDNLPGQTGHLQIDPGVDEL